MVVKVSSPVVVSVVKVSSQLVARVIKSRHQRSSGSSDGRERSHMSQKNAKVVTCHQFGSPKTSTWQSCLSCMLILRNLFLLCTVWTFCKLVVFNSMRFDDIQVLIFVSSTLFMPCPLLKKSDFWTFRVGFYNLFIIRRGLILHSQSM